MLMLPRIAASHTYFKQVTDVIRRYKYGGTRNFYYTNEEFFDRHHVMMCDVQNGAITSYFRKRLMRESPVPNVYNKFLFHTRPYQAFKMEYFTKNLEREHLRVCYHHHMTCLIQTDVMGSLYFVKLIH